MKATAVRCLQSGNFSKVLSVSASFNLVLEYLLTFLWHHFIVFLEKPASLVVIFGCLSIKAYFKVMMFSQGSCNTDPSGLLVSSNPNFETLLFLTYKEACLHCLFPLVLFILGLSCDHRLA